MYDSAIKLDRSRCANILASSFISYEDDCSRKVSSEWSERKRSVDVLQVLEDYIVENGKPKKVMHDNGKQFTSKIFRHFLRRNNIKDKSIPARYPQLQGKIEAYNNIVKNEFIELKIFTI